MRWIRKILFAILVVFIAIQFVQPARNKSGQVLQTDISNTIQVPDSVQSLLKTACYDCHSNNTSYPLYSYIQPIRWRLERHIQEGKEHLNFSEFGALSSRKQKSRLKEIANTIKDGSMPLRSYLFLHRDARLKEDDKELIVDWIEKTIEE